MSLPPWKPETDEERTAFIRWIHDQLDRLDEVQSRDASDNPFVRKFIGVQIAIAESARSLGIKMSVKRKRGAPRKSFVKMTALDHAALDVPRIRSLFVQHWGKRNRTVRPLAEEIAADRWELSAEDRGKLIDRFQRKS